MARPLHQTPQLPAATPQCVAEIVLLRLILLEKQAALAHDRNGSKAPFWHSADYFRSSPISRHFQSPPACRKGANRRHRAAACWSASC